MITNNFNKELRGISDALRDLGYTDTTIGLRQRYPGYNHYDKEIQNFYRKKISQERLQPSRSLHFFPLFKTFH